MTTYPERLPLKDAVTTTNIIPLNPGYEQLFGDRARFIEKLGDAVLEVADFLLTEEVTEREWRHLADYYNWSDLDRTILRELAHKIHTHEQSHHILVPIIEIRAPHLEDYDCMAEGLRRNKRVQWHAVHAVWEAAKAFNRHAYGQQIIRKLYLQEEPVRQFAKPFDPIVEGMDFATYTRWKKIMEGR